MSLKNKPQDVLTMLFEERGKLGMRGGGDLY